MSCLLVSLLSTIIGIVLFKAARGWRFMNTFLLSLGTAVYQLNNRELDDQQRIALSQRFALQIVGRLLLFMLVLTFVVAAACVPFYLIPLEGYSTLELVGYGAAGMVVPCLIYLRIRRQAKASEYPPGKQLFFYLTLGVPCVGKCLFALESLFVRRRNKVDQAIIITGLARAGTTILLQHLHQHTRLQSLTYRHMPLLLAPRVWPELNRTKSQMVERSHRDGILVDLDSPEAFDEYYWRVILRDKFRHPDGLIEHELSDRQIEQYERYAATSLRPGAIYLAKNNNFLLRAPSFLAQRENYTVVIVFRHPVEHAVSLMRQDRLQSEQQQQEPFVLDYMDMLGHHEFGQHRLDFVFEDSQFQFHDKRSLDYWLERWIDYYRHALQLDGEQVLFVGNEQIATDPNQVVGVILDRCGLNPEVEFAPRQDKARALDELPDHQLSPELLHTAETIFSELQSRAAVERVCQNSATPV